MFSYLYESVVILLLLQLEEPLKIKKGDVVAARCTMFNFRDHTTFIGTTNNDEMCNFYIMYYVGEWTSTIPLPPLCSM